MTESFPIPFGKYTLLEKIATGGMAELFSAMIMGDKGFEKLVAIKRILPHLTDQQELVDAFINEARLAALLHHPNIVQIYDFGNIEGSYFIAMEHLFGQDLHAVLARSTEKGIPLGLNFAPFIISGICQALDYAHSVKDLHGQPLHLIHRDISPANVLITYEGEIKLVDFGIAKASGKNTKTRDGLIKGKLCYMSPEQASGKNIDHRSDLFSTGIILYELVTGKPMYQGEDLEILSQVQQAAFESPEELNPALPQRLYGILHRSLSKNPDLRYQSGAEMLSDLEECIAVSSPKITIRAMAQHMKSLFQKEMEAEEQAVAKASQIPVPGSENVKRRPWKKTLARTLAITPDLSGGKSGRHAVSFARVLFALLGMFVLFSLTGDTVSGLYLSSSPLQVQPRLLEPPDPISRRANGNKDASAQIGAAMAALRTERYHEAVALFEEILSSRPHMAAQLSIAYSQALLGQGLALKNQQPEKAEALFLKAIRVDPQGIRPRFELASLAAARRDYSKAIKRYREVLDLDPQSHKAAFNLAFVYAMKKDYPKAEQMYRRTMDLSPPYADEVLFNLAIVQAKQGKKKQSIESLERALALNPNNQEAMGYLQKLKENRRG